MTSCFIFRKGHSWGPPAPPRLPRPEPPCPSDVAVSAPVSFAEKTHHKNFFVNPKNQPTSVPAFSESPV